jgi:hypothetical protein
MTSFAINANTSQKDDPFGYGPFRGGFDDDDDRGRF